MQPRATQRLYIYNREKAGVFVPCGSIMVCNCEIKAPFFSRKNRCEKQEIMLIAQIENKKMCILHLCVKK